MRIAGWDRLRPWADKRSAWECRGGPAPLLCGAGPFQSGTTGLEGSFLRVAHDFCRRHRGGWFGYFFKQVPNPKIVQFGNWRYLAIWFCLYRTFRPDSTRCLSARSTSSSTEAWPESRESAPGARVSGEVSRRWSRVSRFWMTSTSPCRLRRWARTSGLRRGKICRACAGRRRCRCRGPP